MAVNQNLKNALADAGLTVEEFASILAVDPKSVSRWIAGTSTPYPRHRTAISRALALDEAMLWPDRAARTVELDGQPHLPPVDTNSQLRVWSDSQDASAPDPVHFIQQASGPIDLLDSDLWFYLAGPVADALIAHASTGHPIRVATSAPRPNLAPLIRQPGVQLRCVDESDVALICTPTTMVIASRLGAVANQPPALFGATAAGADGLYDRLVNLFETAWEDPVEIITTIDQLEDYRNSGYNELEDDPDDDLDADAEPDGETRTASEQSDVLDPPAPSTPPARRWPGSRSQQRAT
jgi:transcriptional regulator with XRE-family HTH domain